MNTKKIILKSALNFTLAVGAMALTLAGANAQAVSAPLGILGYTNPDGISVYGGLGSFGGYGTGFGSPLGGFFGTPLGGGVSFLGGPYSGGYAIFGPNGATIINPYYQNYQSNQGSFTPNAQSANKTSEPASSSNVVGGSADNGVPLPLSQSFVVRRGRNF